MNTLKEICKSVERGKEAEVTELVRKGLAEGLGWEDILNKGLFAGMEVVGKLFEEEEIFIPEMLMAANAMTAGQKLLEPLIIGNGGQKAVGTVILGTVKGDVHNLGKNLVNIMLKGAGLKVIDLGVDVSIEKFVNATVQENAHIVGMSALLTTTMPHMKAVIDALRKTPLKGKVKTIIGGACVTQQFADEIGADAYAENAGAGIYKVKKLLGIGTF